MKVAFILAAVIALTASPVLAQERRDRTQHAPQAVPYDVYGGKKRHTDPDPNVRFEMMRQRNWRKG
jgi:hypothetical protein